MYCNMYCDMYCDMYFNSNCNSNCNVHCIKIRFSIESLPEKRYNKNKNIGCDFAENSMIAKAMDALKMAGEIIP